MVIIIIIIIIIGELFFDDGDYDYGPDLILDPSISSSIHLKDLTSLLNWKRDDEYALVKLFTHLRRQIIVGL